jgi:hypothetical protein
MLAAGLERSARLAAAPSTSGDPNGPAAAADVCVHRLHRSGGGRVRAQCINSERPAARMQQVPPKPLWPAAPEGAGGKHLATNQAACSF